MPQNRKRDEHKRQRDQLSKQRKAHIKRDRRVADNWPTFPPSEQDKYMDWFGPCIEAAGSLSRALEAGLIEVSPAQLAFLLTAVPISRGGTLNGRDAEVRWLSIVSNAVRVRKLDMSVMRNYVCDTLK